MEKMRHRIPIFLSTRWKIFWMNLCVVAKIGMNRKMPMIPFTPIRNFPVRISLISKTYYPLLENMFTTKNVVIMWI